MPGPTRYTQPSTTPKTRISTGGTGRTGLVDDTGRSNTDSQYTANQRVANTLAQSADTIRQRSAFSAPAGISSGIGTTSTGTSTGGAPVGSGAGIGSGVGGTFNAAGTTAPLGNTTSNEHLYGFAADHFAFDDLPTVWQNPWLIVNAFLKDQGRDTPRLREELRKYGEIGLPLYMMTKGLTDDVGAGSSSATINWVSRWLKSMGTPGGNVPGYQQLLGNILNARGDKTMLGEALNSGEASDQVNTLMTYLRAALGTNTLNPIAASAILSQANREGDKFLEATMAGDGDYSRNFTDWLNSGGHRIFGSY